MRYWICDYFLSYYPKKSVDLVVNKLKANILVTGTTNCHFVDHPPCHRRHLKIPFRINNFQYERKDSQQKIIIFLCGTLSQDDLWSLSRTRITSHNTASSSTYFGWQDRAQTPSFDTRESSIDQLRQLTNSLTPQDWK